MCVCVCVRVCVCVCVYMVKIKFVLKKAWKSNQPYSRLNFYVFIDRTVDRQERGREIGGDMQQRSPGSGVEPPTPSGQHCSCRVCSNQLPSRHPPNQPLMLSAKQERYWVPFLKSLV